MNNQNEGILLNYHRDGLSELMIGLITFFGFWIIYSNRLPFTSLLVVLAIPIILTLKSIYVAPRLSLEDFPLDIRESVKWNVTLLFGTLTLTFFLAIAAYFIINRPDGGLGWVNAIGMRRNIILALIIALLAIYTIATGNWRFASYFALGISIYLVGIYSGLAFLMGMVIFGAAMLAIGGWMFYQFVLDHPVLPDEYQFQV